MAARISTKESLRPGTFLEETVLKLHLGNWRPVFNHMVRLSVIAWRSGRADWNTSKPPFVAPPQPIECGTLTGVMNLRGWSASLVGNEGHATGRKCDNAYRVLSCTPSSHSLGVIPAARRAGKEYMSLPAAMTFGLNQVWGVIWGVLGDLTWFLSTTIPHKPCLVLKTPTLLTFFD